MILSAQHPPRHADHGHARLLVPGGERLAIPDALVSGAMCIRRVRCDRSYALGGAYPAFDQLAVHESRYVAGAISAALYVAAQVAANQPTLALFAVITGWIAGFTFDYVFTKIVKTDVTKINHVVPARRIESMVRSLAKVISLRRRCLLSLNIVSLRKRDSVAITTPVSVAGWTVASHATSPRQIAGG